MKLSRRSFMKANAVAAAAAAAGLSVPGVARAVVGQQEAIKWDKAPCRFCGTGCGVLVGTQQGRVVACQGDPDAPVNRGLNCIKGYFLPKIMYGKDRLTQPLLRMKNGKYDKEGEFTPITWDQAFDVMEEKFKTALKEKGPESIGMFGSGQWTIWEGYAASKLFKAGFRSNNIDPNARHCMASAVVGFMRTFGMDEPMGCYDDIEQADAFVLWGANMAEMHPILWSRITNRRLSNQNVTVAGVITASRTRTTKSNTLMAYVTIEDELASMELLCFSRVIDQCGSYMQVNTPVLVKGRLSVRDEKPPQIMCDSLYPLESGLPPAAAQPARRPAQKESTIYLRFPSADSPAFRHIKLVMTMFEGGTPVKIRLADTGKLLGTHCLNHPALLQECREWLGSENVVVKEK